MGETRALETQRPGFLNPQQPPPAQLLPAFRTSRIRDQFENHDLLVLIRLFHDRISPRPQKRDVNTFTPIVAPKAKVNITVRLDVYEPATDKWEKLLDLPIQRNHLAIVAISGKIIVAGGRTGPGATAPRVDVVEIYDPATRRWTKRAPLPAPCGGITGQPMPAARSVFGGEGEPTVLFLTPNTYDYDPRSDKWTSLLNLPIAVDGLKGSGDLKWPRLL